EELRLSHDSGRKQESTRSRCARHDVKAKLRLVARRFVSLTSMGSKSSAAVPAHFTTGRLLPLLLVLFIGSGFAALVYEIVWFQMVQLVIASSAASLAVLLGTFMGGMCLGSLAMPRVVSARRHPLRVYAAIELGIGVLGLALLFGLPHIDRVYAAVAGTG